MKGRVLYAITALTLVSGLGAAAAQQGPANRSPANSASLELSDAQRAAIVTAVRDARIPPPSHSFDISIGAKVPPSIELYALPIAALSQAPEARSLKYTMVQKEVVLVDPANMHVVEVIRSGR